MMDNRKAIADIIEKTAIANNEKISILPIMCGAGKSSAISEWMMRAIQQNIGILIVTDRKYRFGREGYFDPEDESLKKFLSENKRKSILTITGNNAGKILNAKRQKKYPVVMLTTQRFFSLDAETINRDFLTWNNGEKRPFIIFDEKPELYFDYNLDQNIIDRFETAFNKTMESFSGADSVKLRLIWNGMKDQILSSLDKHIPKDEDTINSFEMINADMPEGKGNFDCPALNERDIEFFLHFVLEHFDDFIKNGWDFDYRKFIKALSIYNRFSQLYSYWRIMPGVNRRFIAVLESNVPKLLVLHANSVIMDGTAVLSMDYYQDGIDIKRHLEVCESFDRELPNLTVVLAKCESARTDKIRWDKDIFQYFLDYMRKKADGLQVGCFSYKDIIKWEKNIEEEDELKPAPLRRKTARDKKEYFGNIYGKNEFRKYSILGQVGLFVRPPAYYLSRFINQKRNLRQTYMRSGPINLENDPAVYREYTDLVYSDILSDIEQNLFRSKIRDPKCQENVKYYIFFDFDEHFSRLKEMIKDRFCKKYKAVVREENADYITGINKVLCRKGESSTAKLVLRKIESIPPDRPFRIDEKWMKSIGKSKKQFESAKQCNKAFSQLIDSWKIGEEMYEKP